MKELSFDEFAKLYCERQQSTPEELRRRLLERKEQFNPAGFMLLECAYIGTPRSGELTILPYGGNATFKTIPSHPISPRGLASDMSVVVATTKAENIN